MNNNYSLGEKLRLVRRDRNMSQEEVALEADITTTYYGMLERDAKSPTVRMLEKICRALDYPISEIFMADITCRTEEDQYVYQLVNLLKTRSDTEKEQLLQIMKRIICLMDS